MKADTPNAADAPEGGELSPSIVFPLLVHGHRRYTVHYLARTVGAVSISEVAEQIALGEGDLSRDRFERIVTGLYHTHLPRAMRVSSPQATRVGVLGHGFDVETVERLPVADRLTPDLDLAMRDDVR